jgi:hypothetical protein
MSTTREFNPGDLVRILPQAVDDGWFGGTAVVVDTATDWDRMAQEEFLELELLWSDNGVVGWIPADHVEIIDDKHVEARVTNEPTGYNINK